MKLLLDVGNTRIKWALADAQGIWAHSVINDDSDHSLAALIRTANEHQITSTWVSNVKGAAFADRLLAAMHAAALVRPYFCQVKSPLAGVWPAYAGLGIDRLLALIGARVLTSSPCIVVDAGTAITIDALTGQGKHLGGVICPGQRSMRNALFTDTAGVRPSAGQAHAVFAQSTAAGVNAGLHWLVVGGIDAILTRMREQFEPAHLFLTGGDSQALLAHWPNEPALPMQIQPTLVLQGLLQVAETDSSDHPAA